MQIAHVWLSVAPATNEGSTKPIGLRARGVFAASFFCGLGMCGSRAFFVVVCGGTCRVRVPPASTRCSAARDAGYGEQLAKVFMVVASLLLTTRRAKLKRITKDSEDEL